MWRTLGYICVAGLMMCSPVVCQSTVRLETGAFSDVACSSGFVVAVTEAVFGDTGGRSSCELPVKDVDTDYYNAIFTHCNGQRNCSALTVPVDGEMFCPGTIFVADTIDYVQITYTCNAVVTEDANEVVTEEAVAVQGATVRNGIAATAAATPPPLGQNVTMEPVQGNVGECGDATPCLNGGMCMEVPADRKVCDCPSDFTGNNCETRANGTSRNSGVAVTSSHLASILIHVLFLWCLVE